MRFSHFTERNNFGWKPPIHNRLLLTASPSVGAPTGAGLGAPPAPAPGTGGGSPAPSPAPAAPAAPTAPPSGPGAPPVSPSGALPANDPNLAVIRSSHDLVTKHGGAEVINRWSSFNLDTLNQEGSRLADSLGYTPESFAAAFKQDPIQTIAYMRDEAARAGRGPANGTGTPPDPRTAMDSRLGMVENAIRLQQVEKANTSVDGELSRVFADHAVFKGKQNVPADVTSFAQDLAREVLKYDQAGLDKILKGDLSPVKAAFDTAMDRFFKAVNAYSQWIGQPTATPGGNGAPPTGTPPAPATRNWNINDLIEGKEDAFQGMAITRR